MHLTQVRWHGSRGRCRALPIGGTRVRGGLYQNTPNIKQESSGHVLLIQHGGTVAFSRLLPMEEFACRLYAPMNLDVQISKAVPAMIRYIANTVNPRRRTQAMNQATVP